VKLLSLIALIGMLLAIGFAATRKARQSPHARNKALALGVGQIALGLVIGLAIPPFVPETQGSPASLVLIVLLWLVGATLVLGGLPFVVAGVIARRRGAQSPRP
jgi:hypothetical protein